MSSVVQCLHSEVSNQRCSSRLTSSSCARRDPPVSWRNGWTNRRSQPTELDYAPNRANTVVYGRSERDNEARAPPHRRRSDWIATRMSILRREKDPHPPSATATRPTDLWLPPGVRHRVSRFETVAGDSVRRDSEIWLRHDFPVDRGVSTPIRAGVS